MNPNEYTEFSINLVLYRDGVPLDPLMFFGGRNNILRAGMTINRTMLDDPEVMNFESVITGLCDAMRDELLRVYCGKGVRE